MKKIRCLLVMLLSLLLTACGAQTPSFEETILPPQETGSASFSFADVDELQFVFASGAGGWGTVMYIHEDGSFEGSYSDSIMETAPEYPNGSYYYSEFSGRFTQPEKVNDTTWRFRIAEFNERYQRGTEEIKEGIRYIYAAPHGLSESEDWYVYLPGAQLDDLPEPFLTWVHLPSWDKPEETELPFYGLYNEKEEFGFSGYIPAIPETAPREVSFADLAGLEFTFSSSAGGWGTELYIHEDGSFDGAFHDHNADDAYPRGIIFYSHFTGRFGQPERIDQTTYRLKIEEFADQRNREDQLFAGIYYDFGDVYGIEDAKELLLYLPGAKLENLPQEYRDWVGYHDLSYVEETELPFYGLYNEARGAGFSSGVPVHTMAAQLESAEEQAARLKENLDNAVSQADMNGVAEEIYKLWDNFLNNEWRTLFEELGDEKMAELKAGQLAWIREKETAAEAAAAEVEGGSLYPLVYYGKAAELTRDRVYFLAEYLK